MEIELFKKRIKSVYNKYPELYKYLDDKKYMEFVYSHMNEIDIEISDKKSDNILICRKLKVNKNYINNIKLLYNKYLSESDNKLINSGKFYVNIKKNYWEKIDKKEYFHEKSRRDYLIPMFLHKITIETFSEIKIDNIKNYMLEKKKFFNLLYALKKYIKTINRLGTLIESSFTLNIYNIRKFNDLDLVVLHPNNDNKNVKKLLMNNITEKFDYVDEYMPNIYINWQRKQKTIDVNAVEFSNGKLKNFVDSVYNPDYSYYFFGIKVRILEYDLKYRAKRRYPKNVVDLILTKDKLNINVPKIKILEDKIEILDKIYTKARFIKTVKYYLKRFNYEVENIEERIKELY